MALFDADRFCAASHDVHGGASDDRCGDYDDLPREWLPLLCGADRIGLFDYDGLKIPRITVDDQQYARMAQSVIGMKGLVETGLDIFDDMTGRVFVQITMNIPHARSTRDTGRRAHPGTAAGSSADSCNDDRSAAYDTMTRSERFMLDARMHLQFFEALAEHSMLAMVPEHADDRGADNIVLIQMPRPDRVHHALGLIRRGLKMG